MAVNSMDLVQDPFASREGLFTGSRDCSVQPGAKALWDVNTGQRLLRGVPPSTKRTPYLQPMEKVAHNSADLLELVETGAAAVRCNFVSLGAALCTELGKRLEQLQSLDLCYCQLGAEHLDRLTQNRVLQGLERLALGGNSLGSSVARLGAWAPRLRRLELEINDLRNEGCELLAQALQMGSTQLQYLDLSVNGIQADGADALARALRGNRSLTYLDLGYNRIGPEGALALGQLADCALKVLRLEDNGLGDAGAVGVLRLPLEELRLGFNQVSAQGAVYLAMLLRGASLRRLDLTGNQLQDAGAAAFAAAMQKSCCLEELVLAGNAIGSAGGAALAQALQNNWRLQALDLRENPISQEAALTIAELTSQARLAARSAPPALAQLRAGAARRWPCWSVRAWLRWLLQAVAPEESAAVLACGLASAVITEDAEGTWYEPHRLKELAGLYGRRLKSEFCSKRLPAQGLYLLNLTPFKVLAGQHAVQENSGSLLPFASTLQLLQKGVPVATEPIVLTEETGERRWVLPGGAELRLLRSRHVGSSTAELAVAVWSWPHRLRGLPFQDLSCYWQSAKGNDLGTDMTSAVEHIIKPDTLLSQSSLAELYGPGPVQTFVSHHWGHDVNDLFAALAPLAGEGARFWLAGISVNHWRKEQRAFAAARRSRSAQSLALVLGPDAAALQRRWCLYEVLASDSTDGGDALTLQLCAPQGLLSEGTGGMPVSYILQVSSAISTLDVQMASGHCDELRELLERSGKGPVNLRLRQMLMEGLSSHRRGQEIFQGRGVARSKTEPSALRTELPGRVKTEPSDIGYDTAAEDSIDFDLLDASAEDDAKAQPREVFVPGPALVEGPRVWPAPATPLAVPPATESLAKPSKEERAEPPLCQAGAQIPDEAEAAESEERGEHASRSSSGSRSMGVSDVQDQQQEAEVPAEAETAAESEERGEHASRSSSGSQSVGQLSCRPVSIPEASQAPQEPRDWHKHKAEAELAELEERGEHASRSSSGSRSMGVSDVRDQQEADEPHNWHDHDVAEAEPAAESEERGEESRSSGGGRSVAEADERDWYEAEPESEERGECSASRRSSQSLGGLDAPEHYVMSHASEHDSQDDWMFSSAEPAEGRSWSSDSVGNGNSEAISANANETNWKTGAAILAQPFPEEDEDTLVLPKAAADMEGDAPEEPCDEVASCFSFRGSDQMCSEYSPSRAYQEEEVTFSRQFSPWPPSDPSELADAVAHAVIAGSAGYARSFDDMAWLEQPSPFKRGFTEDDLAASLYAAFAASHVERLPILQLLLACGRSQGEAEALERALRPLLASQDGSVSCDVLLRFLAHPRQHSSESEQ
ncbi:unnamed protein product [Effrenium voratum]|uniref:Uncharacterized protein n=1 Tax=Effrenium voratum TaxID=2562239 RepID=A0AA36NE73_9DINO|nr:unnamed protein product [Effrenium voratum]